MNNRLIMPGLNRNYLAHSGIHTATRRPCARRQRHRPIPARTEARPQRRIERIHLQPHPSRGRGHLHPEHPACPADDGAARDTADPAFRRGHRGAETAHGADHHQVPGERSDRAGCRARRDPLQRVAHAGLDHRHPPAFTAVQLERFREELIEFGADESGHLAARNRARGRRCHREANLAPVDSVPMPFPNLDLLNRDIEQSGNRHALQDFHRVGADEFGHFGISEEPLGALLDQLGQLVLDLAHPGSGRVDRRCLRCPGRHRKHPSPEDFGGEHGQRDDDRQLGRLHIGARVERGLGQCAVAGRQFLHRLRATEQRIELSLHGLARLAPVIRDADRIPRRANVIGHTFELFGGRRPGRGELEHLVLVAIRPRRAGHPPQPAQPLGQIKTHRAPPPRMRTARSLAPPIGSVQQRPVTIRCPAREFDRAICHRPISVESSRTAVPRTISVNSYRQTVRNVVRRNQPLHNPWKPPPRRTARRRSAAERPIPPPDTAAPRRQP